MIDYSWTQKDSDVEAVGATIDGGGMPVKDEDPTFGEVAVKDPFDIEAAKKTLALFNFEISEVVKKVKGFEIKTDADAEILTETVGQAKRIFKAIEIKRKELIKNHQIYVDGVNASVRQPKGRLTEVEKIGKKKLGDYNYKKEIDRRATEKKMQDEIALRQAEIDAQAKKANVETVQLPEFRMPQKLEPTRSESATSSTRFKKVPKVVDFAALSDDYKMVDEKKLNAAFNAGIIPAGVEIEEVPIVSVRT